MSDPLPLYKLRNDNGAIYEVVYQTALTDEELDIVVAEGWAVLAVEYPAWARFLST